MTKLQWSISNASDLAHRSVEWNALVGSLGYPPFLRTSFLVPALAAFGSESALLTLGYDGQNLVFAGIFEQAGARRWNLFQPSQLPLGACMMVRTYPWDVLLASLARAMPGRPFCLGVTQQDPYLVTLPRTSGCVETLDYVPTAWIDLKGTFAEFWQSRGKNLRQNLGKQRRKLEEKGEKLRFEILQEPHDIEGAFEDFMRLESRSWKADTGTAVTADSAQGPFYRAMLEQFALSGRRALVYRLFLNDEPIAVDFGIRDERLVVILKTTYDEGLKGISSAQLLHERAFQHHFDAADIHRLEFYGKVMEWHTRWTEQSRMLFHITWTGSTLVRVARKWRRGLRSMARGHTS